MHFKKLFPSRFLRAVDFDDGELTLVIDRLEHEMVGQGDDAEDKAVLYFVDQKQGLVLNLTNAESIAEIAGDDTGEWPGHSLTLFRTKVRFGPNRVDAIRIRPPAEPARKKDPALPDLAGEAADRF